ncbi:hypothetical protein ACGFZP_14095 [Kitasatospora sp. NPDC048239]|uniref:hypothetical protein n=1 Tax=Kitasatospora sp. NPDC048239 TaxID=3364046 RepID=UPI0037157C65
MTAATVEQRTDRPGGDWPAVRPEVVAEVVAGLSARLQKRLDGAAAKLAVRPVSRSGDEWRIEVDEETALVLHAPGGVVAAAQDVRCGCLLAPACVHRAAAVTVCRLAEPGEGAEESAEGAAPAGAPSAAAEAAAAPPAGAGAGVTAGAGAEPTAPSAELAPAERESAHHLHRAAAAVLAAGVSGAGAVLQAELLRAAHRARLAGLHRPAAAAVAVVTRVRAARSGEPDHRLADLAAGLRELLDLTSTLTSLPTPAPATAPAPTTATAPAGHADRPDLAGLRGVARQAYQEAGGLRLYGLFAEPVLTATHAGVLSWAVDSTGRLSTVAEVMPHGDATAAAPQAVGAGNRAVRLGDASLGHREFSRAGLAVQGATRSANGRLGAGASVRAVRAAGAGWTAEPLAALWAEPVAAQVDRALAAAALPYESRPAGSDLLFLDVTLLGAAPSGPGGGQRLLAACGGRVVALLAGHEHPGLAFRGNLALLATGPGLRLRVIGRLERAARPELRLLAIGEPPELREPSQPSEPFQPSEVPGIPEAAPTAPALALPADRAGRVNLGLERMQTADLTPGPGGEQSAPPSVGSGPEAPVHLLTRRVEQAVTSGRRALALGAGTTVADAAQLRSAGLATGAALLDGLRAAAADQPRDVFGRVVAEDHGAFTAAWLAAACYGEELASALCAGGWGEPEPQEAEL